MVILTRAQREALFRVFKRDFPNWVSPTSRTNHTTGEVVKVPSIQYRRFRAKVQPLFGGDGCVMLPWAGMWLGIEPDGHTHS